MSRHINPLQLALRLTAIILMLTSLPVLAIEWSNTELHFQYGELEVPRFAAPFGEPSEDDTFILTLQHASGWKYGDNFLFIDWLHASDSNTFNDNNFYGEFYSNFSLGRLTGRDWSIGPIKDVGLVLGINMARDNNVIKYLPGVRFDLDLAGFKFAKLLVTAYLDDNDGPQSNPKNAPIEDDSWLVDFAWAYPFKLGSTSWSFEGHAEYIHQRDNEFGSTVHSWLLAQPQLRFDLGKQLWGVEKQLFIGIEYQYWHNKLGDKTTDESAIQALAVWRF